MYLLVTGNPGTSHEPNHAWSSQRSARHSTPTPTPKQVLVETVETKAEPRSEAIDRSISVS